MYPIGNHAADRSLACSQHSVVRSAIICQDIEPDLNMQFRLLIILEHGPSILFRTHWFRKYSETSGLVLYRRVQYLEIGRNSWDNKCLLRCFEAGFWLIEVLVVVTLDLNIPPAMLGPERLKNRRRWNAAGINRLQLIKSSYICILKHLYRLISKWLQFMPTQSAFQGNIYYSANLYNYLLFQN